MLLPFLVAALQADTSVPPQSSISTTEVTVGNGGRLIACKDALNLSTGPVRIVNRGACEEFKDPPFPDMDMTPTDTSPVTIIFQHTVLVRGRPAPVGAPSISGLRVIKSKRFEYAITPTGVARCKVVEAVPPSLKNGLCQHVKDFYIEHGPYLKTTVDIAESQVTVARQAK